ncbi:SMI1/KNR4 family protein [Kurthia senegalensis]|uniref:SMI1/KNR4 family protein n=1 Tax=Kurthia senegalensis TaxID=1033740 RepID=UPI0002897BFA|nr:SMI1/KNR4 family protein [Kurthia senegalensis]
MKLPLDFLEEATPYFGAYLDEDISWQGLSFGQLLTITLNNFALDTLSTAKETFVEQGRMPEELVPFAATPGGDYFCFDYVDGPENPTVAHWTHDGSDSIENLMEDDGLTEEEAVAHLREHSTSYLAANFTEFAKDLISYEEYEALEKAESEARQKAEAERKAAYAALLRTSEPGFEKLLPERVEYEDGYPVFEGNNLYFTATLPEELYLGESDVQLEECFRQLKEALETGALSASRFTPMQLQDLAAGAPKLKGLVWHHHEEPGKMQLVNAYAHLVRHIGGRSTWAYDPDPTKYRVDRSDIEQTGIYRTEEKDALEGLREVERQLEVRFPKDFIQFFRTINGGRFEHQHFLSGGIELFVGDLLSFNPASADYVLDYVKRMGDRMPAPFVPFACDPFGNLFGLIYTRESKNTLPVGVVYWLHEGASPFKPLAVRLGKSHDEVAKIVFEKQTRFCAFTFNDFVELLY